MYDPTTQMADDPGFEPAGCSEVFFLLMAALVSGGDEGGCGGRGGDVGVSDVVGDGGVGCVSGGGDVWYGGGSDGVGDCFAVERGEFGGCSAPAGDDDQVGSCGGEPGDGRGDG